MLFNSYEFLITFLPLTLMVYFVLNRQKLIMASKAWLVFMSFKLMVKDNRFNDYCQWLRDLARIKASSPNDLNNLELILEGKKQ